MPVIGIPVDLVFERIGTKLDRKELVEHLLHLGCDMEGFAKVRRFRCEQCGNLMEIVETEDPPVTCDRCGSDFKAQPEKLSPLGEQEVLRMELLPVRPDMFDPGGLARVLRNYLGESDQPAQYNLLPPTTKVTVDPKLATKECPRPNIACAVIRGITLNDDLIKAIMKLQENIHSEASG